MQRKKGFSFVRNFKQNIIQILAILLHINKSAECCGTGAHPVKVTIVINLSFPSNIA